MMGLSATRVTDISFLHATWHTRIKANESDYGTWLLHKTLAVIVTTDGEIWIMLPEDFAKQLEQEPTLLSLCPNGKGANSSLFTSCQTLCTPEFMRRQKDPWCEFIK